MSGSESDEERSPILQTATRVIVMQGMSAPTMGNANEADVANGPLFINLASKTVLSNHLYLESQSRDGIIRPSG
jgi:hypothetical protein